jgi:NTE family protein
VLARAADVPDIDVYAIDVSFSADPDATERAYLNDLPTSFVLMPDQVDRLRAAAGRIIRESPDFKRLLVDIQGAVVPPPPVPLPAAAPAARR